MEDIFHLIMEAEGDDEIAPFDVGGEDNSSPQVDASGEDQSPDAGSPPPMQRMHRARSHGSGPHTFPECRF